MGSVGALHAPWLFLGLGAAILSGGEAPAGALELRGRTYFVRAPWKVDLVSYATTVGETNARYHFTISLSPDAGASLGRLTIQQVRGADWQFPFSDERTRAFHGRPRREGAPIAVKAMFDSEQRRFTIDFPDPVPPGETVTVVLKPWFNPMIADTYRFQVIAWPDGPNPVASPVGFGTLRIYERGRW
jgi:hypothetical protein